MDQNGGGWFKSPIPREQLLRMYLEHSPCSGGWGVSVQWLAAGAGGLGGSGCGRERRSHLEAALHSQKRGGGRGDENMTLDERCHAILPRDGQRDGQRECPTGARLTRRRGDRRRENYRLLPPHHGTKSQSRRCVLVGPRDTRAPYPLGSALRGWG